MEREVKILNEKLKLNMVIISGISKGEIQIGVSMMIAIVQVSKTRAQSGSIAIIPRPSKNQGIAKLKIRNSLQRK